MEKTNFFFLLKSSFSFLCKIVKTPDVPKELFYIGSSLARDFTSIASDFQTWLPNRST